MRDESQAPRNSRELAVRNQFFTPRYVVEFLTDNTLGRIWYEMTKGQTVLVDSCQYLVRRPNEVFLEDDHQAPEVIASYDGKELSQEELLQQTVYIQYRPLKDPRDIKMLDPACGSMHFGLYAFDLFEKIYSEAWDLEESNTPGSFVRETVGGEGQQTLHQVYDSKEAFLADVPRLIIEHNIHGVDIDPRATQIAGLSLWLRAQKSWADNKIQSNERPQIKRSNIVCAEPMPGEKTLLKEFTNQVQPRVLGQLVEEIFDKMQLAGEAGTLLKIEEEIQSAIEEAKSQKDENILEVQGGLFGDNKWEVREGKRYYNFGDVSEDFWGRAEQLILQQLEIYSESATGSDSGQKRLFASDAAKGFSFIDLSRQSFDVVLMNPPFGYPSAGSKTYIDSVYKESKYDVLGAFVDRSYELLNSSGLIGCISSRTVFFIEFFAKWRALLFDKKNIDVFADLGFGVLDALVETAAFVIRNNNDNDGSIFVRLLSDSNKELALKEELEFLRQGHLANKAYYEKSKSFTDIDGSPMAYWVAKSYRNHFKYHQSVKDSVGEVRVGLQTGDDFRFLRTSWEVPEDESNNWFFLAKGGEFRKFYDDIHLLVNWSDDGREIRNFTDEKGKLRSRPQNVNCYYRPGITYPMRTTSGYSPRILPGGCIFNVQGNSIFEYEDNTDRLLAVLAVLNSRVFESFTRLKSRVGDMVSNGGAGFAYTPGLIGSMPFPKLSDEVISDLRLVSLKLIKREMTVDSFDETSSVFVSPLLTTGPQRLKDIFLGQLSSLEKSNIDCLESTNRVEGVVHKAYGFGKDDIKEVESQFGSFDYYSVKGVSFDVEYAKRIYLKGIEAGELLDLEGSQQRQPPSGRDLRLDEICEILKVAPQEFVSYRLEQGWYRGKDFLKELYGLLSYLFGVSIGRWDLRSTQNEESVIEDCDIFQSIPRARPGLLCVDSLNIENGSYLIHEYPISVPVDGIVTVGFGDKADLGGCFTQLSKFLWQSKDGERLSELFSETGIRSLDDYFAKPSCFFDFHLKMYSKSRRQSPIYWPLQTESGTFVIWVYFHRIDSGTLFLCINNHIDPKLKILDGEISALMGFSGRTSDQDKEYSRLVSIKADLIAMREEILSLAKSWEPNLDDGVQITAAPLWKLFQHGAWRNRLKKVWSDLRHGSYDWSHMAYSYWPDRVLRKCHQDLSLAIAHQVDSELWFENEVSVGKTGKVRLVWEPKEMTEADLDTYIQQKISKDRSLS